MASAPVKGDPFIGLLEQVRTYPGAGIALSRKRLTKSFRRFVRAAWHLIEPDTPLSDSPYIDAICDHLQALTETREYLNSLRDDEVDAALEDPRNFRFLLVNMPPRSAKSTIINVLWPAWMWTREASAGTRILNSSYAYGLAERDANRSKEILQSKWWLDRWGHVTQLQGVNRMNRYYNSRRGYRMAVGKSGSTTGEGGDVLIADDPESAGDAYSVTAREHTIEWFGNTWSNRRNDPKRSIMVVVQQRIHESDLSGYLLEQGGCVHLNLPMEYEGEKNPTILGWQDWREVEGEWLNPSRFSQEQKDDVIRFAGEMGYATQFQQRPVKKGGAILKDARWGRYVKAELPDRFDRVAVFADTASKTKQQNDYTAMALWGQVDNRWWLLDLVWKKLEFPQLVEEAQAAWTRWKRLPFGQRPTRFIIEDANSGTQLIQTLRNQTNIPVREYSSGGSASNDKVARINAVAAYQYNGYLMLPKNDDDGLGEFNVQSFISEHSMFPRGKHDDRVDTTGMMMMYWEIDPPEEDDFMVVATGKAQGRW